MAAESKRIQKYEQATVGDVKLVKLWKSITAIISI